MHTLIEILEQSWLLVLEASPYLLFGFVLAGLLHTLLPTGKLIRWLGHPNWRSVLNAAVIGTPLPLCSCSVVPVADTLRKGGASKGATTAFLISTPESGVDSIAVTYGLMDPIMTIARPVAAMLTAFAAGIAQNIWGGEKSAESRAAESALAMDPCGTPLSAAASSCCGDTQPEAPLACCGGGEAESTPAPAPSCCCGNEVSAREGNVSQQTPLAYRLTSGLRYGLVTMFEDLAKYFVVGFLIAGALAVVLNEYDPARQALHTAWAPFVMLVAGIPMYVCASAATPMVAVLIAQGLSPGAALVFLLAGPATNAASLVVLRRILGQRATATYLVVIMISALALGYALEAVYALAGVAPRALEGMYHEHTSFTWLHWIAAVVFAALIVNGMWWHYGGRMRAKRVAAASNDGMDEV